MSTAPDDDALSDYDLHAWQPPAPPAGLADAIVARMQQTPAPARAAARNSARTIVAAAVATIVAAAAIAVVVVTHADRTAPRDEAVAQTELATPPSPTATPLPAGTPGDVESERVRILEERVAELEARLAELEAAQTDPRRHVDPFKTPPPRPIAPVPVPAPVPPSRHVDPLDPFSSRDGRGSPSGSDDDLVDPFAAKSCDAAALIRQGKGALATGAYPAASTLFEAALHCDPTDVWALKLAYMAACHTGASALASEHYKHLSANDQAALVQLCVRFGIDPRPAEQPAPTPPPATGHGKLTIASRPTAHIYIDGADTHLTTPVSRELPPGKHKVTFEVDGNKYTYPITVRDGETVVMNKEIQ